MSDEGKGSILERCELKVVEGPDGPRFEAMCESEDDRAELNRVFNQEAILRIKPRGANVDEKVDE